MIIDPLLLSILVGLVAVLFVAHRFRQIPTRPAPLRGEGDGGGAEAGGMIDDSCGDTGGGCDGGVDGGGGD